jgi:hypothetical protein
MPRHELHHELVRKGVEQVAHEERITGGSLGPPSGAKYRAYQRLQAYGLSLKDTLYDNPEIGKLLEELVRYPLRPAARDALNRQLKSSINDAALFELVLSFRSENRLFIIEEEREMNEPQILCSLGCSGRARANDDRTADSKARRLPEAQELPGSGAGL